MKKTDRFPWRPLVFSTRFSDIGQAHTAPAYVKPSVISPVFRPQYSNFRPRINYNGVGIKLKAKGMENRIVANVLEKNVHFLSRHLVLSPTVLEKLREAGLITEAFKRQLAFKDTDEQIPALVRSFDGRGLQSFRKFLGVLRETGHGWMVDNLLNTQALSFEEIASAENVPGRPDFSKMTRGNLDRLEGLTPEHARRRLTSGRRLAAGYEPEGQGSDWRNASFTPHRDVSLGSLIDQRMRGMEGTSPRYRGQVSPAAILDDPVRPLGRVLPGDTLYDDIPGTLVNLHGHFKNQSDVNEQTLTTLKREELAIKDLLEQNARDQMKVRRNQYALTDIGRRLEEINTKATEVYDPVIHGHLSRYRLAQLNQIPWSTDQ